MDASALSERLGKTDQVQEHHGDRGPDAVPQEVRRRGETPFRDPVRPSTPEQSAFETFAGGAGI
jgi:hypothetical protein